MGGNTAYHPFGGADPHEHGGPATSRSNDPGGMWVLSVQTERLQKLCLFLFLTLLAGAGDLTGDAMGYVTGVLAVLIHAAYLVLIQKTSVESEYGPLTAQYAIAVSATPFLIICSFASMDSINVWSFPGWKDPAMVCIFIACVLISCAMNFTTLHCTYINSAVTTSFVGVVKSIATITVGMVAFNDVEPTKLFIAGVVVNTLGSVIYCVAKYVETRRKSDYEDLEKEAREEEEKRQAGDQALFAMEAISREKGAEEAAAEGPASRDSQSGEEEKDGTVKPAEVLKTARRGAASAEEVNRSSLKDAYLGVWRFWGQAGPETWSTFKRFVSSAELLVSYGGVHESRDRSELLRSFAQQNKDAFL
nr:PREDICTED: solute carrier family 35 member D3 [Struthio camelus australis]